LHLTQLHTIRALKVTHDLASFQDGLFRGESKPWSLVGLAFQEPPMNDSHRSDDFCRNAALSSMIASFEFRLALKAESTKLLVSLVSIHGRTATIEHIVLAWL
jgi:hypothetical protein